MALIGRRHGLRKGQKSGATIWGAAYDVISPAFQTLRSSTAA
jgi:hypothetical protein